MAGVVARWLGPDGALQSDGLEHLEVALASPWTWVDVTDPDLETMRVLAGAFGLHPLAVEDSLHVQARPKLDVFSDGLFLAWLTPEKADGDRISATELDAFLGAKHLITVHAGPVPAIGSTASDIERALKAGPDWVLHSIIDRLVDATLPIVDGLGDELDEIEDDMLGEPRKSDLQRLYRVRRHLVQMHRIVAPERDLLRGLARERDFVSEEAYRYFQDVSDHLARVEDAIETYRDVGAGVMDIYLSAQSNRMNEIMKQLTVVATIFMPLTLISGIYGMNVVRGMWPAVTDYWSFSIVVGSMAVIAAWMTWYFRRRKWW